MTRIDSALRENYFSAMNAKSHISPIHPYISENNFLSMQTLLVSYIVMTFHDMDVISFSNQTLTISIRK